MRRKIKSAFACYSSVGNTIEIFPASRIKYNKDKNIAQIIAPYFGEVEHLGIRYGTFQEEINVNDNILEKYPQLSRSVQPKKHLQQDYTLLPLNKENKDTKWILSEVKVQDDNLEIPKFLIPITPQQMEKETVKDLLLRASSGLDMQNTPVSLSANGEAFEESKKVSEVYEIAKQTQITYNCVLGEEALKLINTRTLLVEDIRDSEEFYISELEKINSFWDVELKSRMIFSEFELNMMMSEFTSIINCHKIFYDEVTKLVHGYQTQLAGLFVAHASMFAVTTTYIANYPQINEIVTDKMEHSTSARKELNALAKMCDGKDLLSFLIAPVNRIPKYQVFLKNLRINTPMSHPDDVLLEAAQNSITKILRDIKTKSQINEQKWRLKKMEKKLLNNFKIYDPNRIIINKTKVKVIGHSENKGALFVFNDIIVLTKKQQKGITVLFDCPAEQFHYAEVPNNPLGITVGAVLKHYNMSMLNPRKDYTIIFDSTDSMRTFFTAVIKNQTRIMNDRPTHYSINWKLMNTRSLPAVSGNAAAANGTEFIFFGGEGEDKKNNTAKLSAITQIKNEYIEIPRVTKGRSGHTITLISSKLFIVGGKNHKKFFSKILSYDMMYDLWSQVLPNNREIFEPRYGHTTTLLNNKLFIIGGKTADGKILNSVTIFDPFDNLFCKLSDLKNPPPPRYHHTAVAYQDKIIIHGGKTNGKKLLNDTWELDLTKNEWVERFTRGEKPQPRKCHGQFIIGNTTIIIGGVTTNGESPKTISINLQDNNISKKIIEIGNVPNALRKFAHFKDRRGRLFIYGGKERKSTKPCHSFYMIEPDVTWLDELRAEAARLSDNIAFNTGYRTLKNKRRTIAIEKLGSDDDDEHSEMSAKPRTNKIFTSSPPK